MRQSGISPLDAISKAVTEVLAEQVPRVRFPRKQVLQCGTFIGIGPDLRNAKENIQNIFLDGLGSVMHTSTYAFFVDQGEKKDVCTWWQEFIKANSPIPSDAKHQETAANYTQSPRIKGGGEDRKVNQENRCRNNNKFSSYRSGLYFLHIRARFV